MLWLTSLFDPLNVIDCCGMTFAIDHANGIKTNPLMPGLMFAEPMKGGSSDVLQLDWGYGITWNTVANRAASLDFAKYQDGIFSCNYV
jgi:hypothetical protein